MSADTAAARSARRTPDRDVSADRGELREEVVKYGRINRLLISSFSHVQCELCRRCQVMPAPVEKDAAEEKKDAPEEEAQKEARQEEGEEGGSAGEGGGV